MCLLAKCKFISNGGAADVMQESARCDRRLSECLGGVVGGENGVECGCGNVIPVSANPTLE